MALTRCRSGGAPEGLLGPPNLKGPAEANTTQLLLGFGEQTIGHEDPAADRRRGPIGSFRASKAESVDRRAPTGARKGATTMITGLRGVSIWSENLNNLLPFYRDVLGLEVTTETPGFVVLGGLWLGTHSEVHGRNADPARHMIGLTSNNLKGDWERLKGAGVEFVEDPTDYGTVWIATLKDPEGNLVQLLQSSRAA
jgi:predicted enzyme related to lactoylglutathione lyase